MNSFTWPTFFYPSSAPQQSPALSEETIALNYFFHIRLDQFWKFITMDLLRKHSVSAFSFLVTACESHPWCGHISRSLLPLLSSVLLLCIEIVLIIQTIYFFLAKISSITGKKSTILWPLWPLLPPPWRWFLGSVDAGPFSLSPSMHSHTCVCPRRITRFVRLFIVVFKTVVTTL